MVYCVFNGIVLILGGLVGDDILCEFEDFVRIEGMILVWYFVNVDFVNNYLDFKCFEVVEEVVLSCENIEFKGKKF